MGERIALLAAFARARWSPALRSPRALAAHQARALAAFLAGPMRRAPFYAARQAVRLADLPVVDKAAVLADFAAFNTRGVALDDAVAVALAAERSRDFAPRLGDLTVGLSSGTSGRRGVFLADDRERATWAGTILARLLGGAELRRIATPWAAPLRVSLVLRANSNLYRTVGGRRVRFAFHDLLAPFAELAREVAAHRPHVLVAPSSVLRALADDAVAVRDGLAPDRVIAGAEVLEPDDAAAIARAFGAPVLQVYQCTEGFLGYGCERGGIHLNEQFVHFEREWLDAERSRFQPVITDFSRRTQVFARYRLDDVLRAAPPCPCGRAEATVAAIEGRADDVLWAEGEDGAPRAVFPDAVRRALLLADGGLRDYTLVQHGARLELAVDGEAPHALASRARAELLALYARLGLRAPRIEQVAWRPREPGAKRRRIRCAARPGVAA